MEFAPQLLQSEVKYYIYIILFGSFYVNMFVLIGSYLHAIKFFFALARWVSELYDVGIHQ